MIIRSISLTKSKTVGLVSQGGKSHFKKITITASAEIEKDDDPDKAYENLSAYLESRFLYEKNLK